MYKSYLVNSLEEWWKTEYHGLDYMGYMKKKTWLSS